MNNPNHPPTRHVFTYGSLMYPSVWTGVVRGQYRSEPALLTGFRRYRVVDETYPAALRDAQAQITGRLYFDVDDADMARLDQFEGADYERIPVPVQRMVDGEPIGEWLSANLYLYLRADRIEARDWDPAWFESEGIRAFSAQYQPRRGD